MKTVDLVQGSVDWHAFRMAHIGSSDAPIVDGSSPYRTRRQLAAEKIGALVPGQDDEAARNEFIFARGHAVEKVIRRQFEELTQVTMNPIVAVHPKYEVLAASLDGFDSKLGPLEAKLVGKDVLARAHDFGEIPPHHFTQLQHQMEVVGADRGHWFGHDGKATGFLIEVKAKRKFQRKLIRAELTFWERYVLKKKLPPLSDRDYLDLGEDPELRALREAKEHMDNAAVVFEALKDKVIASLKHSRVMGAGIAVVKGEKWTVRIQK